MTGKHNVVLRGTTEAIARKLGNALVAPIVPFVPEGDIDPPTIHMKYPGTISVTEATFEALLTDICASLRSHEFQHIILIGDSGGNQQGMTKVAARMNENSKGGRLHFIPEYYDFAAVAKWLEEQGIRQTPEGLHDDFAMTATMMSVDPESVRSKQRIAAGKFRINGVDAVSFYNSPRENCNFYNQPLGRGDVLFAYFASFLQFSLRFDAGLPHWHALCSSRK